MYIKKENNFYKSSCIIKIQYLQDKITVLILLLLHFTYCKYVYIFFLNYLLPFSLVSGFKAGSRPSFFISTAISKR